MLLAYRSALYALTVLAVTATALPTLAQKPKTPPQNQTKGQAQLAGGVGQFGVTYSLQGGINFTLLSAKYTLDPFLSYEMQAAGDGQKLFVMDLAIKNASSSDNSLNPDGLFTLVDEKGTLYNTRSGSIALLSQGAQTKTNLRPGQGIGQPSLKDPLQIAFTLPDKVRIVKIMLNQPLLNKSSDVVRYFVAGATKEEAGAAGDPKNVVTPVPENARDSSDKSGAVALDEAKGTMGTYVPSGSFLLRLDSLVFSTGPINNDPPADGKKYAIATVTAKSMTPEKLTIGYIIGGDFPLYQITDSDGERAKPSLYLKAKSDEDAKHDFEQGDEYTFRIVFLVDKNTTLKKLVLGTGQSHRWAYDVSGVK